MRGVAIMARNKVQFQKGLSFAAFHRLYASNDQCHAALLAMRWPNGFVCLRQAEHWKMRRTAV